jgi:hypothetical protein
MAGPRDNVLHLFSDDGPVIEGEIIGERTQADIQREWKIAKAESEALIAACRAESAEARAADQVARDLREKADVVRAYRLEAEADIEADRLAKEDMKRRAFNEQRRRAGLIRQGDVTAMLDAMFEVERGVISEAVGSAMADMLAKSLGPASARRAVFDGIAEGFDGGIVTKGSKRTVVELWPETGENQSRFMDRCQAALSKCIGPGKASRVCRTKWKRAQTLGTKPADEKSFVLRGLSDDEATEACGASCTACKGRDAPFDPERET